MIDRVKNKVNSLEPLLVNIRRYLHQNPELSGQEVKTSNYILAKLQEAGIDSEIIEQDGRLGVIGNIIVDSEKETIAFRADMDALPLIEKESKAYSSKNYGVMHACGHDFNVTTVLGAALVLAGLKNELDLNVKFIFQSAEETPEGGANALIKAGIMKNVKAIFAVHALPSLPAGKIGIKYGAVTAAVDTFKLTVNGTEGHSARPHQSVDAIYVATQIINCLYADIARNFDPIAPIAVSVGKISGGTASNIIAGCCEIEGTVRTFDSEIRDKMQNLIRKKASNVAHTYDASVNLVWNYGPSSVINDKVLAELVEETASSIICVNNVERIEKPSMGAEDFSRFLPYAPGMLIRIGTGGENCSYSLHSCMFDIDETAISIAVNLLSLITLNFQKNKCNVRNYIKNLII